MTAGAVRLTGNYAAAPLFPFTRLSSRMSGRSRNPKKKGFFGPCPVAANDRARPLPNAGAHADHGECRAGGQVAAEARRMDVPADWLFKSQQPWEIHLTSSNRIQAARRHLNGLGRDAPSHLAMRVGREEIATVAARWGIPVGAVIVQFWRRRGVSESRRNRGSEPTTAEGSRDLPPDGSFGNG